MWRKGRGSVSAAEEEEEEETRQDKGKGKGKGERASGPHHQVGYIRMVPTAGPYIVLLYCGGPYCACVQGGREGSAWTSL